MLQSTSFRQSSAPACGLLAFGLASVLASAGMPAVAGAADSMYGGHLGTNDDPIVLVADKAGQKLKGSVIAFQAACKGSDPTPRVFHESVSVFPARKGTIRLGAWEATRNAKGRIAATYSRPQNVGENGLLLTMKLAGTLKRGSASGTLSATWTLTNVPAVSAVPPSSAVTVLETCSTGVLRWTAKHSPGIVYAGRTAQDEPLVVRLSKDRLKVEDVDVGWHATCTPAEGWVDFPETFAGFPIGTKGRFGDAFTWRYPRDDGTRRERLRRTTSAGRSAAARPRARSRPRRASPTGTPARAGRCGGRPCRPDARPPHPCGALTSCVARV